MHQYKVINESSLQVDVFINRDLDSRFNAREASAVNEWRKYSNLSIHSMRDHPYHNVALLGASWGTDLTRYLRGMFFENGNNITAREAWKLTWKRMLRDDLMYARCEAWGPDQIILDR